MINTTNKDIVIQNYNRIIKHNGSNIEGIYVLIKRDDNVISRFFISNDKLIFKRNTSDLDIDFISQVILEKYNILEIDQSDIKYYDEKSYKKIGNKYFIFNKRLNKSTLYRLLYEKTNKMILKYLYIFYFIIEK